MTVPFLIAFVVAFVALLAPLLLGRKQIAALPVPVRILGGLVLLAVAAFCGFGFLASFEPVELATQWTFRIIYTLAGLGALGGAFRLFRIKTGAACL